jgi:exosome complex component CSL4
MSTPAIAVPGQDLGSASKYIPGPGTHIHNSHLYASSLGFVHVQRPQRSAGPQKRPTKITPIVPTPLPTISVTRLPSDEAPASNSNKLSNEQTKESPDGAGAQIQRKGKTEILPEVNSIVLCKVTRITPRQATVAILVVGETVLDGEWQGLIRVQDVRATEKDRVKIFESFRPGDVVRAIVVSFPPLDTACQELGCSGL